MLTEKKTDDKKVDEAGGDAPPAPGGDGGKWKN